VVLVSEPLVRFVSLVNLHQGAVMSRLFVAMLLCVFVVMVRADAVRSAPAPLPRKGTENPAVRDAERAVRDAILAGLDVPSATRVREVVSDAGYHLRALRPGPNQGEWIIEFSAPPASVNDKPQLITSDPITAEDLQDTESIGLFVELRVLQVDSLDTVEPLVYEIERIEVSGNLFQDLRHHGPPR
jgi:hypothetical protein